MIECYTLVLCDRASIAPSPNLKPCLGPRVHSPTQKGDSAPLPLRLRRRRGGAGWAARRRHGAARADFESRKDEKEEERERERDKGMDAAAGAFFAAAPKVARWQNCAPIPSTLAQSKERIKCCSVA